MRVLILGAYGFIGSEVARLLLASGHQVRAVGRAVAYGRRLLPQAEWIKADLAAMAATSDWSPLLDDVDGVVNASGLLQSGDGGSVAAVQEHAVKALVQACVAAGVQSFVQISATGAALDASTDFMRTKARADAAVLASGLKGAILRPGFVIGRNSYGGTELVRGVAALPIRVALPFAPVMQCVALSDVAEAVETALMAQQPFVQPVDLVEQRMRTLDEIIAAHRAWLAFDEPRLPLRIPAILVRAASIGSDWLGRLGWRAPLRTNAIKALSAGVTGNSRATAALLGREPRALEEVLAEAPAGKQDRIAARLYWLLPLILASLVVMWLLSGVASLLDLSRSEDLFEDQLGRGARRGLVFAGALIDIGLALALLWRPTARTAAVGMVLVTIGYMLIGSVLVPSLWLDPLAPLAKALPGALLAVIAAWMLDRR